MAMFWRKPKKKEKQEPALEPPTEYDSDLSPDQKHILEERDDEILEDIEERGETPSPDHTVWDDTKESEELSDHSSEGGLLARLGKSLGKSKRKLNEGIHDIFARRRLDSESLAELEDLLIAADLGPGAAARLIEELSEQKFEKGADPESVKAYLAERLTEMLKPVERNFQPQAEDPAHPATVLICGVNGTGKTTTIGKLAYKLELEGHSVTLAAADTFRAAAVEQLQIWADRAHCHILTKEIGADPASVAFEAHEKCVKEGSDTLIVDTAGRLQNKKDLMAELEKIVRVLKKKDENAPHEVILVLDATTGQNALSQVQTFQEMVNVTGLILTKLEGSAKGGVLVALAEKFGLPVYAVGIGEQIEDLQPFDARAYAHALMGIEQS